jgi:hypothetical protein
MARTAEINLHFSPYIPSAPQRSDAMYAQSCSNDKPTIASWRDTWLRQFAANKAKYGSFAEHSAGSLYNAHKGLPAIVAGSGPSLAYNGHLLKDRGNAILVSALHNFHFFEDRDIPVDYYVTLDAGPVTIEEVSEGGQHDEEWYWARTEKCTLLAYCATHPDLLAKWRGRILFFNCPIPDLGLMAELDAIEKFNTFLSTGGNVLGGCFYFAKGIFGCSMTAFVGADFSFGYNDKFHGWDSKYDKSIGNCMRVTDIFGNKVRTWPSYHNFKVWFDWVAENVPGIYVNCTEGGTFGAYDDGNILSVRQMELAQFLAMLNMSDHLKDQCEKPAEAERKVLF